MKTSETVGKLNEAKAAFQAAMPTVGKSATNTQFSSRYADIGDILGTALPIAGKHGLSLSQHPEGSTEYPCLVSRLSCGDEWEESQLPLFMSKFDAQGFGSALTYARKYAATAILGIATDDDDGNAAVAGQQGDERQPQASVSSTAAKMISEAQVKLIGVLSDRLNYGTAEEAVTRFTGQAILPEHLTAPEARKVIDGLKAEEANAAVAS